ncbi:MAG: hypothetical protein JWN14_2633 [Chthonomonadales bacterium]|nr:hypothetical protein [Chthonomonadales bacterium]
MHDISPETLRFIEENAPDFVLAVQHAKEVADQKQKPAKLKVVLETFEDDPFLLYACLWLALSEGVEIRLMAK